jgi:hypothetical protein
MREFRAEADGIISVELNIDEVAILVDLIGQLSELLRDSPQNDDALHRLLPDAYPNDSAAAAEFRRFTSADLVDRKLASASVILSTVREAVAESTNAGAPPKKSTLLRLDPSAAQSWLTSLGDLRLTIAARLGIVNDGDEGEPGTVMTEVYDWLGYLQSSLVDALDQT